ncbi:hypothetical protein TNCT_599781 [Trichonephila clavata]|uniref:Uncharacterized protein n=1 Tax=Trichonephila clavata TaxID=2740835 RepID=A0A8X6KI95_TRICU|nr:hypothetical protein TNCT_599781 [Trichonephila clavata]
MVKCRLREFLESRVAFGDCQAGFRRHRFTVDQVMKLTQAVKDGFHRKQSTLAVCWWISKLHMAKCGIICCSTS